MVQLLASLLVYKLKSTGPLHLHRVVVSGVASQANGLLAAQAAALNGDTMHHTNKCSLEGVRGMFDAKR